MEILQGTNYNLNENKTFVYSFVTPAICYQFKIRTVWLTLTEKRRDYSFSFLY